MIIWSGLGFLVVIFFFGAALLCNLAFDAAWGEGYYSAHQWTIGVAMFIGAALSWVVGNLLRKRTAQTVIDKATGKEIVLDHGAHRLFFIPMHYWGLILGCIGVVLCVMEVIQ
jgi:drug/metabolite transporter (DMT)-like permease